MLNGVIDFQLVGFLSNKIALGGIRDAAAAAAAAEEKQMPGTVRLDLTAEGSA